MDVARFPRLRLLLFLFVVILITARGRGGDGLFTSDGAWCWFSDPRAIFADGKVYAGWMTSDGSVQVGVWNPAAPDQPAVITTLAHQFERDDHDHPALLALPDGRLATFYAQHDFGDMHFRVTEKPGRIDAWRETRTLGFNPGGGSHGVTYANPVLLRDEADAIHLFWRGTTFKPTFAVSRDLGKTWSAPRILIAERGSDEQVRPYVKYWSDDRARIDLVFTDGHPRDEPTNSIYYLRYAGGCFFKADGTLVGTMDELPFDPAQCDRVYDGSTGGRAWVWSIAADAEGNPVIVYTRHPTEDDHRYHYARWTGERWLDVQIVPAGKWFPETPPGTVEREPHYSGGAALDPQRPETVYTSRPIGGVFEIERWSTSDGGRTWRSEALTQGSRANNVRPIVVRGTPPGSSIVMWMRNTGGYVHYTDYRSELRISVVSDSIAGGADVAAGR